jgi:hypothetical protein
MTIGERLTLMHRQDRVRDSWGWAKFHEPDISTEQLIAMVATETGESTEDVVTLYLGGSL